MKYAIKIKASYVNPTNEEKNWPLTLILLFNLDTPFVTSLIDRLSETPIGNGLTCGLRMFDRKSDAVIYAKAYIRHNKDCTMDAPGRSCFKLQGGFAIHKVEEKEAHYTQSGKEIKLFGDVK